ncbi:hypothetical protein TNCV_533021 [Trichonephila clavipes]|nr:hypothetical protein TNCV_533021 [Trichonephila clavipes]
MNMSLLCGGLDCDLPGDGTTRLKQTPLPGAPCNSRLRLRIFLLDQCLAAFILATKVHDQHRTLEQIIKGNFVAGAGHMDMKSEARVLNYLDIPGGSVSAIHEHVMSMNEKSRGRAAQDNC